jgi:hypothetical protein
MQCHFNFINYFHMGSSGGSVNDLLHDQIHLNEKTIAHALLDLLQRRMRIQHQSRKQRAELGLPNHGRRPSDSLALVVSLGLWRLWGSLELLARARSGLVVIPGPLDGLGRLDWEVRFNGGLRVRLVDKVDDRARRCGRGGRSRAGRSWSPRSGSAAFAPFDRLGARGRFVFGHWDWTLARPTDPLMKTGEGPADVSRDRVIPLGALKAALQLSEYHN